VVGSSANGFRDVSSIKVGPGGSAGWVYSGGYWQSDTHRVPGLAINPPTSKTYCVDGAYDYERCGLRIDGSDYRGSAIWSSGPGSAISIRTSGVLIQ
jgi:hypothetical protein